MTNYNVLAVLYVYQLIHVASCIFLSQYFITSSSCVTINIVDLPLNSDKSSSILYLLSLSKAPVGSSAKIIRGSFNSNLAIATLCYSPPLNV